MPRIKRDDIDRFFAYNIDPCTKTLYLGSALTFDDGSEGGVDHELAELVIKGLHVLDLSRHDDPIKIIMNNPGGDEYHGLAIYDAIKDCQSEVHIKIYGQCMSMGAWVMQAADRRIMSPNSRLMIHVGYMGLDVNHPEINKAWMKQYERDEIVFEDLLLDRIREKHPNYSREQVKKLIMFDAILMPQEAVDLGLADEVE